IEADRQVRNLEFIEPRTRQALQVVAQIITEQACRTALKRRQTRNLLRPVTREALRKHGKRVRARSSHLQPFKWVSSKEGVPAQVRMTQGTVEKEHMRKAQEAAEELFGQRNGEQFFDPGQRVPSTGYRVRRSRLRILGARSPRADALI